MKKILAAVLTLVIVLSLSACVSNIKITDDSASLLGTWGSVIDGEYGEITFNSDYTGKISAPDFEQEFQWEVYENVIYMTDDTTIEMTYQIVENTLYLTAEGDTQIFTKTQGAALASKDKLYELIRKILELSIEFYSEIGRIFFEVATA